VDCSTVLAAAGVVVRLGGLVGALVSRADSWTREGVVVEPAAFCSNSLMRR
jgi:hypothetical protein